MTLDRWTKQGGVVDEPWHFPVLRAAQVGRGCDSGVPQKWRCVGAPGAGFCLDAQPDMQRYQDIWMSGAIRVRSPLGHACVSVGMLLFRPSFP